MNESTENEQEAMGKKEKVDPYTIAGHPLHTMRQENLAVEAFMAGPFQIHLEALDTEDGPELRKLLLEDVNKLAQVESHYRRIEVLLLPFLEQIGQIAPVKVMISIHGDVLRMIRDLRDDLQMEDSEPNGIRAFAAFLIRDIQIIIRQEREAYSELARTLVSEADWGRIARASDAFGYCMIDLPVFWTPEE